jgi:hypothetical protein
MCLEPLAHSSTYKFPLRYHTVHSRKKKRRPITRNPHTTQQKRSSFSSKRFHCSAHATANQHLLSQSRPGIEMTDGTTPQICQPAQSVCIGTVWCSFCLGTFSSITVFLTCAWGALTRWISFCNSVLLAFTVLFIALAIRFS